MRDRRNGHEDFIKERRKTERRASERLRVEIPIELTAGGDLYFHVSGDISVGGAYFDRAIPHPIGTVVKLTFRLPDEGPMPIHCKGEVVNLSNLGEVGMGVKFMELAAEDLQRIERFSEKLPDNSEQP